MPPLRNIPLIKTLLSKKSLLFYLYLFSFFIILIPRTTHLGKVLTIDEPTWMTRSSWFFSAVSAGRFEDTFIAKHPGVTVMWVVGFNKFVIPYIRNVISGHKNIKTQVPSSLDNKELVYQRIRLNQLTIGITTSIIAWFACLWFGRAFHSPLLFFLSALLIGTDPFYLGLCRIVHLDGMMATCLLASLSALTVYFTEYFKTTPSQKYISLKWLVFSGFFAGLSLLTRNTTIIIIPWVLILFIVAFLLKKQLSTIKSIVQGFKFWAFWLGIILFIFSIGWPVIWVNPLKPLMQMADGVIYAYHTPHAGIEGTPSYISSILNYFIRLLTFTTPWVQLILLSFASFLITYSIYYSLNKNSDPKIINSRWIQQKDIITTLFIGFILLSTALIFPAVLGLFQKQSARYILPSFVIIDILAALSLTIFIESIAGKKILTRIFSFMIILLLSFQAIMNTHRWLPYTMAYRNPLLINFQINGKTIPYGWGEGLEIVAGKLNQLEGSEKFIVAAQHYWILDVFFKGKCTKCKTAKTRYVDFIVVEKSFVDTFPDSEFLRTIKKKYPLFETIFLPQNSRYPIAWIYCNKNNIYCSQQ